MVFVLFLAVTVVGFFMTGTARALTFTDWDQTWFKVKVSEKGEAGPVVPPGGKVVKNDEKSTTAFLLIETFDITSSTFPFFNVGFCTFDGSDWIRHEGTLPVYGGEATYFLAFFEFQFQETQSISQTYWIPLEVKGSESRQTAGEITSASFKNLGGVFLEEIGAVVVLQRGVGSVKFTGSFIGSDQVDNNVPAACRVVQ